MFSDLTSMTAGIETDQSTGQLFAEDPCPAPPPPPEKKVFKPHKPKIYWRNVFTLTYFHISSIVGVYLIFTNCKWQTLVFGKCHGRSR